MDYRYLATVDLKGRESTGKTKHFRASISPAGDLSHDALLEPKRLAIVRLPDDEAFYLLYLDKDGNELTDTYHETLEGALDQASFEFDLHVDDWEFQKAD